MPESARKRLDSWKEVATYLDRDVTTVMRWEREKKLPVHRLPGGKRKAVFAYPDEIDAWYASADPKENGESSEGAEPREVPAEGRSLEPAIAPIIDTPNPPSKRWRRTALVLVPAVVILLGLGAMTAARLRPAPQLKVSSYLPLTRDGHDKGGPLFTDGARVYFLEQGPDGPELAAVAIAGSGTAIIPCGCLSVEDFSPLHSEVLASRPPSTQDGGELWVMPLLGGSPRRVGDIKASYATWSSDRRRIAFTRQDALYIANADGSEALRIANVTGQAAWPRWSPDGSTLRFTEDTYQHGEIWETLWEVAANGSNLHRLLDGRDGPQRACCGMWTPDGKFFIFQAIQEGRPDLWALSESRGSLASRPTPVLLSSGLQGFSSPTVSADGKQVFALGLQKRGELVRYDSRLREFVPFLGGISATWATFSRSGRSVAYIDYPDLTVWRANADGTNKTQVTFSPLQADGISWSPDEKWLALRARTPGKDYRIYLVPAAGGKAQMLLPGEAEQGVPAWSSDSTKIAFGDVPSVFSKASGTEAIHILDLSTHQLSDLPGSGGLWTVRWSPDGRTLAALTIAEQRLMLYDQATKRWRATEAKDVDNPNWSFNNEFIYYDTEGEDRRLRRVRVADGHVEELVSLHSYPNLATWWSGVAPDNSPLILRNLGITEIYALTLESR
jgi:Tol biopolymer transport system component